MISINSLNNKVTNKLFAYKSFIQINRIQHWITHRSWYSIKDQPTNAYIYRDRERQRERDREKYVTLTFSPSNSKEVSVIYFICFYRSVKGKSQMKNWSSTIIRHFLSGWRGEELWPMDDLSLLGVSDGSQDQSLVMNTPQRLISH